ncbi:MAG: hypothetical protein HQ557_12545 [Bacteroidetes bacterium]|nr:hypothetical protein [Bacteroidota bacterium]
MKKLITLLLVLLFIGSSAMIFSQNNYDYADRTGRVRLGADFTMPTFFISLDLTEFLGGPTIHYGLTDTIELKATVAPLVRVSTWLTEVVQAGTTGATFAAIGLVEVGARLYFSPYRRSMFLDTELVAGFIASDYDFINNDDSFMFKTAGSAFGVSVGYDFGGYLSVEAGAYLITPTLDIGEIDFGEFDIDFIPIPKVSVTYMF